MAKNIRKNVEELLNKYPETRSNDRVLLLAYWEKIDKVKFGDGIMSTIDFLMKATPAESITRARRLVQGEHENLASDNRITRIRKEREREMRKITQLGEVI